MPSLDPRCAEPLRVKAPLIPRGAIIRVSRAADPETAVREMAERDYAIENADAAARISQLNAKRGERDSALLDLHRVSITRDNTSPGFIRPVESADHPITILHRLSGALLYVLTFVAWCSAMWQTSQWIIQAEIFENASQTLIGALLMTGIVITAGVAVPLIAYTHRSTDVDKKRFHGTVIRVSFITGLVWVVMFALVAWAQDRIDFATLHGSRGAWLSVAALGSLTAFCKAMMLPAGIIAECAASVAMEISASRYIGNFYDRVFCPNAYFVHLDQLTATLRTAVASQSDEIAATEALKEAFDLGRKAFIAECLGEYRQHIEERDAAEIRFTTTFVRNASQE
ncbi:hypothetical protein [Roseicella sp. DB1501]|uniref:hypothetical protein n=1 Tax=Roseicella sp. DB1501 TaxID=2730925 RepID=UPI0014909668|nr:hypothetical protein [Roseicella sp. DB1501]